MKLLIAGGRDFNDYSRLKKIMDKIKKTYFIEEIVCGMASGADSMGYFYAIGNNIKVAEFPADWEKYGKRAGYLRNKQMGDYCDKAIIFWDGKSKGTKLMIDIMSKYKDKETIVLSY